jgi:hypothetical protein
MLVVTSFTQQWDKYHQVRTITAVREYNSTISGSYVELVLNSSIVRPINSGFSTHTFTQNGHYIGFENSPRTQDSWFGLSSMENVLNVVVVGAGYIAVDKALRSFDPGRVPNVERLNLSSVGIKQNQRTNLVFPILKLCWT